MSNLSNAGSIVLAGGKSTRLGHEKALEVIGNMCLLRRVVSSLHFLGGNVVVVAAEANAFPGLKDDLSLKVVSDIYPGKGPSGGIYTGLVNSSSDYNVVVACDMPFLNRALLEYMVQQSNGFDCVILRFGDKIEPLHGIYSRRCLEPLKGLLERDILKIRPLFKMVKTRYIEEDEINRFDPEHMSFFNINNKKDLELARKLVAESKS